MEDGVAAAASEATWPPRRRAGDLRWTTEQVLRDTPSRRDGVSDQAERSERFAAGQLARNTVKELLGAGRAEIDEARGRAQMLACLFVQLFYMFRSLRQEDSKVVAAAAAFLACKVADVQRRMRDLLRFHNMQRTKEGNPELAEEEQRRLRDRVLRVEFLLLRIISFDFDIALPLEEVDGLTDRLLTGLTRASTFRDWAALKNLQPVAAATELKPQVMRVARNFLNDAFLGMGPLMFTPRVLAAGAVVFATRFQMRKSVMPMQDMCRLVEDADVQGLPERATEEILKVFKMSSAQQAQAAKAAAGPAAPVVVSAAMPSPLPAAGPARPLPAATSATPAGAPPAAPEGERTGCGPEAAAGERARGATAETVAARCEEKPAQALEITPALQLTKCRAVDQRVADSALAPSPSLRHHPYERRT